jgi:hypothetical protein
MRHLITLGLLVLIISLLPDGLPSGGFWWDFLAAVGYCGLVVIAFLGWDSESPSRPPRSHWHRNLGIAGSVLILVHAVGYLILDWTLVEYLLPAAPGYMLAGSAAGLGVLLITISSLPGPRRATYGNFTTFRKWHRALFLGVLGATLWHALGTDFLMAESWRLPVAGVLLGLLPLGAYLGRRRRARLPLAPAPHSTGAADQAAVAAGGVLLLLCLGYAQVKALACAAC